ncbi:MAG TPA: protein kinase [Anaerolineae bacterium]|nr:protein kinase [Anaerolineae bacterium]
MITDPLIGRKLANFRIERPIGRGGMAQVYYGQDIKLKRPVAIKVIDARHRDNPAYAKRFVREAQIIARWRHEHIIQIYYADKKTDLYYFVMEYIEGQDLGQMIARRKTKGKLISPAEVLRIGRAVASALDYAHQQGIIHRDVKPSNVMVAKNGRVVLTDFGLAMNIEQGSMGEVFGSADYIAPEQARYSADAVPQSDLYSLGVILYEMLTGRTPFNDPSATTVAIQHLTVPPPPPRKLNPNLSRATEAVLLKALSKSPEKRYQTGAELMGALEKALAVPASTHKRWLVYAGAVAAIILAAIAAVFWLPGLGLAPGLLGQGQLAATTPVSTETAATPVAQAEVATKAQTQTSTPPAEAFDPPTVTLTPITNSEPTSTPSPPASPTLSPTPVPSFTPAASATSTAAPVVAATPAPLPIADTQSDFSGSPGGGKWQYQWSEGRDSFNWKEMQFDGSCWRTANSETYVRICGASAHPGLTGDIAWRWQSDFSGPIQGRVSARKLDTQGGDGVVILVYRNTTEIKRWELGANDSQGFSQPFETDMAPQDYLFFVIKAGGDSTNDEIAFRAQIYR